MARKKARTNRTQDPNAEPRQDHLEVEGTIADVYAGGHFTVALDAGPTVKAIISGRMRRFRVRVLLGDRVRVSLSPYDLTHGLVTYRSLDRSRHAA